MQTTPYESKKRPARRFCKTQSRRFLFKRIEGDDWTSQKQRVQIRNDMEILTEIKRAESNNGKALPRSEGGQFATRHAQYDSFTVTFLARAWSISVKMLYNAQKYKYLSREKKSSLVNQCVIESSSAAAVFFQCQTAPPQPQN